jgi:metal transporter CNNM
MATPPAVRLLALRPVLSGFSKLLLLALGELPLVSAAPVTYHPYSEDGPRSTSDPNLWLYLGVAAFLVLSGGAFAGLTIALMGQVRLAYSRCHENAESLIH